MKFGVGDRVRFLNETGEGVVVKIIDKKSVLLDLGDGMEIPVMTDDLFLLEKGEAPEPEVFDEPEEEEIIPEPKLDLSSLLDHDFSKKGNPEARTMDLGSYIESLSTKIVDLHIEKLADHFAHLSNSEILFIQLDHFQKIMDEALSGKHKRIIFVHGVGNGVLKRELRTQLKSYAGIEFSDADIASFGFGATEVIIH